MSNKISNEDQINFIIREFNFCKVHKIMKLLDWKWGLLRDGKLIEDIPTIKEMQELAKSHLSRVAKENEFNEISSGGFTARKTGDTFLLSFAIEEWSSVFYWKDESADDTER